MLTVLTIKINDNKVQTHVNRTLMKIKKSKSIHRTTSNFPLHTDNYPSIKNNGEIYCASPSYLSSKMTQKNAESKKKKKDVNRTTFP